MKKTFLGWMVGLLGICLILWGNFSPVVAAPLAQMTPFPTPTPGPDGRIMYIVQPGDSLWRISAVAGISLDELRRLNGLGVNDVITPGQNLLLGLGGPSGSAPTVGPAPTATSELPTPTPGTGAGTLCVLLYQDINGDAIRQEEESSLPGGAISVNDRLGEVNLTAETPSGGISEFLFPDPVDLGFVCFDELEKGEYNVTVAIPDGYNDTTRLSEVVTIRAGEESLIAFGAQPNAELLNDPPGPEGTGLSPTLGIIGFVCLLAGVGLGIYSIFRRR